MSKEVDYTSPKQKPEPAEVDRQSESVSTEADQTSLQQKQESGEGAQTAAISKQAGQTLTYRKQKSESEDAQTESVSQDADRPWHQKQESDEDAQTENVSEEADQTQSRQKQDSEKDAQTESAPKNSASLSEVNNIITTLLQQLPESSCQLKLPPVILLHTDLIRFETIFMEENSTGRSLMPPLKQIVTKDEVTDITPSKHTRAKDTIIVECPPSPSADRFAQVAVDRTKTIDAISVSKSPVIEQSPVDKEKEVTTGPSVQELNELPGRKRYAETGSLKQSPRDQDETEVHASKKAKDTT